MDLTLIDLPGHHKLLLREEHGSKVVKLTDQQFLDLITVHLADWLEQVAMSFNLLLVLLTVFALTPEFFCIIAQVKGKLVTRAFQTIHLFLLESLCHR